MSASMPADAMQAMQDDVAELLRAVGLPDYARPSSPHEVVQREILPAVRSLAERIAIAERYGRDARMTLVAILSMLPTRSIKIPLNVLVELPRDAVLTTRETIDGTVFSLKSDDTGEAIGADPERGRKLFEDVRKGHADGGRDDLDMTWLAGWQWRDLIAYVETVRSSPQ